MSYYTLLKRSYDKNIPWTNVTKGYFSHILQFWLRNGLKLPCGKKNIFGLFLFVCGIHLNNLFSLNFNVVITKIIKIHQIKKTQKFKHLENQNYMLVVLQL